MSKRKEKPKIEKIKEDNQIHLTNGQLRAIMLFSSNQGPSAYQKMVSPSDPKKMSGKTKIKLMRLSMRLNPILEAIEKVRKELVDKYCERDEKGEPKIKLPDHLIQTFSKKDKEGKIVKDQKGKAILEIPENFPKESMIYDFGTLEKEKAFNKEWAEVFEEDAEVPGEKITLNGDDIPEEIPPVELIQLESLINFKE